MDRFLSKLGSGLSSLGSELRKTAGIGVGSIEMDLEGQTYAPGDTIVGDLVLHLQEDTKASRLAVALVGYRDAVRFVRDSSGRRIRSTERVKIHEFELLLDGEKTYEAGAHGYHFELPVPMQTGGPVKLPGKGALRDLAQVAVEVASLSTNPVQWHLKGFLHIPWKRNVSKKVHIAISHLPG